jgi:hypothetical protein
MGNPNNCLPIRAVTSWVSAADAVPFRACNSFNLSAFRTA